MTTHSSMENPRDRGAQWAAIYGVAQSRTALKQLSSSSLAANNDKGTTEDEMVGWHHRLNGHGFGWTLGVGDGQGGLACCSSYGRKESDMTE